ncbi:MAG: M3 family oligoendopeptidase [Desulfomonile sp.]|nr:M3 family oligoendopeptidase [Desulfomonile sp.]
MFATLPENASSILDWTWEDLQPYYADLAARSPAPDSVTEFLNHWTRLSELVGELASRLYVAVTVNTADSAAEKRYHRFLDNVYPPAEAAEQRLRQKLLSVDVVPAGFEIPLKKMRVDADLFREANLLLKAEEHKLSSQYDKIMGSQTVEWEGKEITVAQLRPVYQEIDRDRREKAWRIAAERQYRDRDAIGDLWRKFMDLRLTIATNAGFSDYRSYRWLEFHRFDYTPDDCKRFHRAIEKVVVPAAQRVAERRRIALGLPSLRPWDLDVDQRGRPALKPFREASELIQGASAIFHRLHPQVGAYFDTMASEGLLDLENRKNKAPGGYCTDFPAAKRPFVFMNAVGIHDDVQTLLHESGHCFHTFEKSRLPFYHQREVAMEFSEVASMAMELLAAPYLAKEAGGFYSKPDAARAVVEHLSRSIQFWPYMAAVDAFQHWVYEHPSESIDSEVCERYWAELYRRFVPWIDWAGLEDIMRTRWQRQLHILTIPFYYVEYGLAQLGAVQVWANSKRDPYGAVGAYLKALSLGGTVGLPELYAAAGAKFAFDAETLSDAVDLMEHTIEELEPATP